MSLNTIKVVLIAYFYHYKSRFNHYKSRFNRLFDIA